MSTQEPSSEDTTPEREIDLKQEYQIAATRLRLSKTLAQTRSLKKAKAARNLRGDIGYVGSPLRNSVALADNDTEENAHQGNISASNNLHTQIRLGSPSARLITPTTNMPTDASKTTSASTRTRYEEPFSGAKGPKNNGKQSRLSREKERRRSSNSLESIPEESSRQDSKQTTAAIVEDDYEGEEGIFMMTDLD